MSYDNFEEAIRNSRSGKAISSDTFNVRTKNGMRPAQIVMEEGCSPKFVYYSSPSITVQEETPYTCDVDSVTRWESY